MAEFTYPARVDARLESHVSRILDEAGVPNFIWGEPVLSILGVNTALFVSRQPRLWIKLTFSVV